jgi:coatomer subunit epsilon
VGLAKGTEESMQGAYYIYEELAQSSTSTAKSLLGQAIAELHLNRLPEAEATLQQALEKEPQNPDILANAIVCATLLGKDSALFLKCFPFQTSTNPSTLMAKDHPLAKDLREKSALFDSAAATYSVKAA